MPPTASPDSNRSSRRRLFRLELTELEKDRLERRAEAEGTSSEAVLHDIVRGGLGETPSAHDLASSLAGCLDGPPDLASNPAHLDGFGT